MLVKDLITRLSDEFRGKNNKVADFVLNFYIKEGKFPSIAELGAINWDEKRIIPEIPGAEKREESRLKTLIVRGIRKYGKYSDNLDYGLNLCNKNGRPVSIILLGDNGIGKTSLFASMELVGKGYSDIARSRGFNNEKDFRFFSHYDWSLGDSNIGVELASGRFIRHRLTDKIVPISDGCFFTSESDVKSLERSENYSDFILEHLGLKPWSLFRSTIKEGKAEYKKSSKDSKSIKRIRYGYYDELAVKIDTAIESIIKDLFPKIKDFVTIVLSEYFLKDNGEEFNVRLDGGNLKFSINYSENRGHAIAPSPNQYLNTFRFKLFVFSLKLALGLCVKIHGNFDFPYIIDDLFDSSDFSNRMRIESFISKIVESHDSIISKEIENCREGRNDNKLTAEDKNHIEFLKRLKTPQIILFTQDHLIADGVYNGLRANFEQQVVLGRLFSAELADEKDIITRPSATGNASPVVFVNLFDTLQQSYNEE